MTKLGSLYWVISANSPSVKLGIKSKGLSGSVPSTLYDVGSAAGVVVE